MASSIIICTLLLLECETYSVSLGGIQYQEIIGV
jgi:hypothetical protein